MSRKIRDLTGQRFGRLVVLFPTDKRISNSVVWCCQCDCGNIKEVSNANLMNGNTQSCGCLAKELSKNRNTTHGETKTKLYSVWRGMKKRCYNLNDKEYHNYGGRGIKMCQEWANSYEVFREWALANGYDENALRGKCTLDRIDVNGDYTPQNCRWVDMKVQNNNKRSNHLLTAFGKTKTMEEWAKEVNIPHDTLWHRIDYGWDVETALKTPVRKYL